MGRILTALLAFHWTAAFAFAAARRLAVEQTGWPWPVSFADLGMLAIAAAYGLAAILFLWTLIGAFVVRDDTGDMADAGRLALAGAVAALTLDMIAQGIAPVSRAAMPYAAQLAALTGTYLVMQADRRLARQEPQANTRRRDTVNATARLMALGAAHRTMLDRRVSRFVAANDERRR